MHGTAAASEASKAVNPYSVCRVKTYGSAYKRGDGGGYAHSHNTDYSGSSTANKHSALAHGWRAKTRWT